VTAGLAAVTYKTVARTMLLLKFGVSAGTESLPGWARVFGSE